MVIMFVSQTWYKLVEYAKHQRNTLEVGSEEPQVDY